MAMSLFVIALLMGLAANMQPPSLPNWWHDLFAPRSPEDESCDDPELKLGSETLTVAENELYDDLRD